MGDLLPKMETWQTQSCGLARKSGSLHMGVRGRGRAAEKEEEEGRETVARFRAARMAMNPQVGTWHLSSPGFAPLGLGATTPPNSGSDCEFREAALSSPEAGTAMRVVSYPAVAF